MALCLLLTSPDMRAGEAPGAALATPITIITDTFQLPSPAFAPQAVSGDPSDPANTNNLLQLARRLHEEHVREGMEKRDALIAELEETS